MSSPPSIADIHRAKMAAMEEVRREGAAIIAAAQAEAAAIMTSALDEVRDQAMRMAGEIVAQLPKVTVPEEIAPPSALPLVSDIIRAAALRHGVSVRAILGPRKDRMVVVARMEAMATAYDVRRDLSLPAIGRLFGRDHTTILNAARKAGVWRQVRGS
jgi:chromosomal replication initiation ATPase DnaA